MKIKTDEFPFTIFSESEIKNYLNVILLNSDKSSEGETLGKILYEKLNATSALSISETYSKLINYKVQNDYESLLKESVDFLNNHPQLLKQQIRTLFATLYAMTEYEDKAKEMSEIFKYWPRLITKTIKKGSFVKALNEEIIIQIKREIEKGKIIVLSIIAVLLCHLKHNISSEKDIYLIIDELITFSSGKGVSDFYVDEIPFLFSTYNICQMKDFILVHYNDILNDAKVRGIDSRLYNCVELYVEKMKCNIEKEKQIV